jgi:DNA-binding transcriptional ArsR family regulator
MPTLTFNYMVEQEQRLNDAFASLADPTRRDILKRVAKRELSIGEIALSYHLTFAAISKHLMVLAQANLISKHREGKKQMVRIIPHTLKGVDAYMRSYEKLWTSRLERLDKFLTKNK